MTTPKAIMYKGAKYVLADWLDDEKGSEDASVKRAKKLLKELLGKKLKATLDITGGLDPSISLGSGKKDRNGSFLGLTIQVYMDGGYNLSYWTGKEEWDLAEAKTTAKLLPLVSKAYGKTLPQLKKLFKVE